MFTVWGDEHFYEIEQTKYGLMLLNEEGEGVEIDLYTLLDEEFKHNF